MLNSLVFENDIIIYWDRVKNSPAACRYRVVCGEKVRITSKTHCKFSELEADASYVFTLEVLGKNDKVEHTLGSLELKTAKSRKRIDVTKAPYYAVGDGKTLNTKALQRAIDDCAYGETVYIPAGVFLSGALNLHDDMELYLEKGAVLQGSKKAEDYLPKRPSRFEGIEMLCYSALLNMGETQAFGGYNCKNVVIRGGGTVRGGGGELRLDVINIERARLMEEEPAYLEKIKACETVDTMPGRYRPRLINVSNSQNVIIEGISIENGPAWNLHILYSDNVITANCTFHSVNIPNGDGYDPDSSTNCTIFNCDFYTSDDSIAIKSGKNPDGNIVNRPCKNIKIFDCHSEMGHGCSIGSEMSGGVDGVYIWDCDFEKSIFGFTVKTTKKRGGYVKNLFINNCVAPRIMVRTVGYNDDGESAKDVPILDNFIFEDLILSGKYWLDETHSQTCPVISLTGFDESGHELTNVVFRNIYIQVHKNNTPQNFELNYMSGITFENISIIEEKR